MKRDEIAAFLHSPFHHTGLRMGDDAVHQADGDAIIDDGDACGFAVREARAHGAAREHAAAAVDDETGARRFLHREGSAGGEAEDPLSVPAGI